MSSIFLCITAHSVHAIIHKYTPWIGRAHCGVQIKILVRITHFTMKNIKIKIICSKYFSKRFSYITVVFLRKYFHSLKFNEPKCAQRNRVKKKTKLGSGDASRVHGVYIIYKHSVHFLRVLSRSRSQLERRKI